MSVMYKGGGSSTCRLPAWLKDMCFLGGGGSKKQKIVRLANCCQAELWRRWSYRPPSWSFSWEKAGGHGVAAGFRLLRVKWGVDMAMRPSLFLALCPPFFSGSHGLKLINSLLGVALTNLPQGFVLVSACFDILSVQHVVLCFLCVISSFGQLWAQSLEPKRESLMAFSCWLKCTLHTHMLFLFSCHFHYFKRCGRKKKKKEKFFKHLPNAVLPAAVAWHVHSSALQWCVLLRCGGCWRRRWVTRRSPRRLFHRARRVRVLVETSWPSSALPSSSPGPPVQREPGERIKRQKINLYEDGQIHI